MYSDESLYFNFFKFLPDQIFSLNISLWSVYFLLFYKLIVYNLGIMTFFFFSVETVCVCNMCMLLKLYYTYREIVLNIRGNAFIDID